MSDDTILNTSRDSSEANPSVVEAGSSTPSDSGEAGPPVVEANPPTPGGFGEAGPPTSNDSGEASKINSLPTEQAESLVTPPIAESEVEVKEEKSGDSIAPLQNDKAPVQNDKEEEKVLDSIAPLQNDKAPVQNDKVEEAVIPAPEPKISFAERFLEHMKKMRERANFKRVENIEKNLEIIIKEAWKTEKITNNDVERVCGVSDRTALRYLKKLVKTGKLMRFGEGTNIHYKPL